MKILFIVPDFSCGGAERVSVIFAKQLKEKGNDVFFVNLGTENGEMGEWIHSILPCESLNCHRVLYSFFKLFKVINRYKADYVYSSRIHVSLLLLLLGFFIRMKLIIRMPTMPENRLYKGFVAKSKYVIFRFLEKKLYPRAYKLIAQTEEMRQSIIRIFNLSKEKVITIVNPIDIDLIQKQIQSPNPFQTQINFLAVGNICYAKSYDTLIEAFVQVHKKIPLAHLYILGRCDTSDGEKILMMARPYKDYIHFLGFQKNPYVYMRYCSVFVLSSRQEGLPNVLLEAYYLNRPLVATLCVPIIKEIITEGKNGYIVGVENVFQLENAMVKSLTLPKIKNEQWSRKNSIVDVFD